MEIGAIEMPLEYLADGPVNQVDASVCASNQTLRSESGAAGGREDSVRGIPARFSSVRTGRLTVRDRRAALARPVFLGDCREFKDILAFRYEIELAIELGCQFIDQFAFAGTRRANARARRRSFEARSRTPGEET